MDPTSLILAAANSGSSAGTLTQQLQQLGYTTAQISQLFNQVSASSVATPQIVAYLQAENAQLQSTQQNQNYVLLAAVVFGGWLLLRHRRRSRE